MKEMKSQHLLHVAAILLGILVLWLPCAFSQTMTAGETEQLFHTVRDAQNVTTKTTALFALRNGKPDPHIARPFLVDLLKDRKGEGQSGQEEKNLIRRFAMEIVARMQSAASDEILQLLVDTISDPREDPEVAAQAAITISALRPTGELGSTTALALANVLNRENISAHLFDEVVTTLGELKYDARGTLGLLIRFLDDPKIDRLRYRIIAEVFNEITNAIKGREGLMGYRELWAMDRILIRGARALKKNGADRSIAIAENIEDVLQGLREAEKDKPMLWLLRCASLNLFEYIIMTIGAYLIIIPLIAILYIIFPISAEKFHIWLRASFIITGIPFCQKVDIKPIYGGVILGKIFFIGSLFRLARAIRKDKAINPEDI